MPLPSKAVSPPAGGSFWPPPLPFRSRPPQSNCPPGNVRLPDYGQPLEPKSRKGGISLLTPPTLARRLQSLPPMLHMRNPSPMPRCSKAPRGLFVQVCVTRVFTGISVSPGPSLRQRPSRYTFRAGRNLPDKEFRYLRTVRNVAIRRFVGRWDSIAVPTLHVAM